MKFNINIKQTSKVEKIFSLRQKKYLFVYDQIDWVAFSAMSISYFLNNPILSRFLFIKNSVNFYATNIPAIGNNPIAGIVTAGDYIATFSRFFLKSKNTNPPNVINVDILILLSIFLALLSM